MTTRPSVVIGLGTTGSRITTRIHQRLMKHCELTGDNPNSVQFINFDTDSPVDGSDTLQQQGSFISLALPNAKAARRSQWNYDPFFKEWWPEKYQDIGNLVGGAGTVPIHGRFAFWTKNAPGGASGRKFLSMFKERAVKATDEAEDELGLVDVYIFSTLSGGTGAGCFLDVAQMIRSDHVYGDSSIYGFFLMPDIVNMIAASPVHQKIRANAYGCLIDLNYWLLDSANRPDTDLLNSYSPFMKKRGMPEIKGDDPAYDAVFLIARNNAAMHAFGKWTSYLNMLADAGSMMLFGASSQDFHGRMNDFLVNIKSATGLGGSPQPQRFGSLGTYALRYSPGKAQEYLTNKMEEKALDAVLHRSLLTTEKNNLQVNSFMKANRLREMDESGDGSQLNEVLDHLGNLNNPALKKKPYKMLSSVINNLNHREPDTNFVKALDNKIKQKGQAKAKVYEILDQARASFNGELPRRQTGVNYEDLLVHACDLKYDEIMPKVVAMCREVLKEDNGGVPATVGFLRELASTINDHKDSLLTELHGDREQGSPGDYDNEEHFSLQLDDQIKLLENKKFKFSFPGILGKGDNAVQLFQNRWWSPYFSVRKTVLEKEAACALYVRIEESVLQLHGFLHPQLEDRLAERLRESEHNLRIVYGVGTHTDSAIVSRESYAIHDGKVLTKRFKSELDEAVRLRREMIRQSVGDALEDFQSQITTDDGTFEQGHEIADQFIERTQANAARISEKIFSQPLQDLSVWDALGMASNKKSSNKIIGYVQERLAEVKALCQPMWMPTASFGALGQEIHKIFVEEYDQAALRKFNNEQGVQLTLLGEAEQGANRSKHVYKVLMVEGGVPLQFHDAVEQLEDSFILRREEQAEPVMRDARIDGLIEHIGIPTWIAKQPDWTLKSTNHVTLLMLEHRGVLKGPLVTGGFTSGSYSLFGGTYRFGNARPAAFENALDRIEKTPAMKDEVEAELRNQRDTMNRADWLDQYVDCYKRVHKAHAESSSGEIHDYLKHQRELLKNYIMKEFRIDLSTLMSMAQNL